MNKEEMREYKRVWARDHKETMRAAAKRYYKNHSEEIKKYQKDHREQYLINQKERRLRCPHIQNQVNYYCIIRRMINRYKQGKKLKHSTTEQIIGISKMEFMKHLESTLPKGKTIKKDYGRGKYEVDHIIPCNKFDLGQPDQLKMCFNWRNMRLIKSKDNLARDRSNDVQINREGYQDNRCNNSCHPKGSNSATPIDTKIGTEQKN